MIRDEENRRLAELVGYTFGDDGLCIEPTGHYNVPVPDFYADEAANALLLEKMPQALHIQHRGDRWTVSHLMWPKYQTTEMQWIDLASERDRKTAIVKAALAYLEREK